MTAHRIFIARLPSWARLLLLVAIPLVAGIIVLTTILVNRSSMPGDSTDYVSHGGQPGPRGPQGGIQHYLYVLPDGGPIYVYDMDHAHALAGTILVPRQVTFVRGIGADPAGHALYIAFGSVSSHGQLLKLDLLTKHVVYVKTMPKGIDSFDMTPDGKTIFMPDGDGQSDGIWRVVDAATGSVVASIDTGGHASHNTIVSLSGAHVYMGPRLSNYLVEANTATHQIVRRIGPVQNGVRPFTINSKETLAFIETSGFIGFDVANINSGQILYTVPVPEYSFDPDSTLAPSHGISLSPDERELYLSDWPHSLVHVFDVSGLPAAAPRLITSIRVHNMVGQDTPCVETNCMKEGWLLHSRDGRFVYVGDAGDVIDTATRQSVALLRPLANTRKFIEIDWQNGVPISTTTRYGKGYAGLLGPSASLSALSGQRSTYAFVPSLPKLRCQGISALMEIDSLRRARPHMGART
jgi:DNA-binding beta-propeller fold protein YncE